MATKARAPPEALEWRAYDFSGLLDPAPAVTVAGPGPAVASTASGHSVAEPGHSVAEPAASGHNVAARLSEPAASDSLMESDAAEEEEPPAD